HRGCPPIKKGDRRGLPDAGKAGDHREGRRAPDCQHTASAPHDQQRPASEEIRAPVRQQLPVLHIRTKRVHQITNQNIQMSQLKDLITQVDQAPSARDAIILCQDRWVKNYMITTGKKDGEARFQSELLNLLDIAADKPLMKRAPKFEYFKAMMVISRTGLSLAGNGHIYIEPYEEVDANRKPTGVVKIKVTVGNHGKREMLRSMKEIKDVSAGHVVMDGDEFQYDELNRQVIKHVKTPKSATDNSLEKLVGAYVRVEYADGHKVDVYMMKSEILRAKAKSKNKRDDGP